MSNNKNAWLKFEFAPDEPTRRLKVDYDGKVQTGTRIVDVVGELKRIPGLTYELKVVDYGYDPYCLVFVRDSIGKIVELYLSYDETYADMPLAEFINRTLGRDPNAGQTIEVLTKTDE